MMKKIKVVAAVIFWNDLILCVQRPKITSFIFQRSLNFQVEKLKMGETNEDALHRELLEELSISAKIKSFFMTVVHEYPDFELTMHSYICEVDSSDLILCEHIDKKWLKINELNSLDWAGADIPIVEKLISNG